MGSEPANRRRAEVGYARGDETRRRILDAGLRLFGERGFDAVSTREIAASAGVKAAALQYYFSGKSGLFEACSQYGSAEVQQRLAPLITAANGLLQQSASVEALIDAYCALVDALGEAFFDKEEGRAYARFLAADQAGFGTGAAHRHAVEHFAGQLDETFVAIVQRLTGGSCTLTEARLRVLTINGQFLVFQGSQRVVEEVLGGELLTADMREFVRGALSSQIKILLRALANQVTQPR